MGASAASSAKLSGALPAAAPVPPALTRFDLWTGDAEIAGGTIKLKQNQVRKGFRKRMVDATVTLGDPPKAVFAVPRKCRLRGADLLPVTMESWLLPLLLLLC